MQDKRKSLKAFFDAIFTSNLSSSFHIIAPEKKCKRFRQKTQQHIKSKDLNRKLVNCDVIKTAKNHLQYLPKNIDLIQKNSIKRHFKYTKYNKMM